MRDLVNEGRELQNLAKSIFAKMVKEAAEEKDDDDEGSVECDDFIHEGVEYTRDENGIVYDIETAEPIGKWTGTGIELFPVDEDEEDDE